MAKNKRFEEQSFEDFCESNNFEFEEVEQKPRTFFGVVGALAGVLALSVGFGALLTAPGFVWGSAAAHLAVPIAEFWKNLPEEVPETLIGERNVFLDKNGSVFAEVWTEDRIILDSKDQISQYATQALIDTEDKRFYEHNGFDPIGTIRAALSSGGGSGITQQLVKNLQFYDMAGKDKKDQATEESYNRKIQELKYSLNYEKTHTKDEILLEYFNTVAFGAPNIYSIESAAKYFFGKNAKDLTIAESAALVGSVKNPSIYDLDSDDPETVEKWQERKNWVISRMLDEGSITAEEAEAAKNEELILVRSGSNGGSCAYSSYPFYCDYVMDYLLNSPKFGETPEERSAILARGGLTVHTNLDPVATDVMNAQLASDFGLENRLIAPTAIVEPGTGAVRAIAANRAYGEGPGKTVINLAASESGTGSTYKMFALAAAFDTIPESEMSFSSSCPLVPGPNFDYPEGGFGNSNGCGFQNGYLDYKKGTAWSSNTYFVTLAMKTGMDKILKISQDLNLNIDGLSERSLSTVLGSKENSPINMAAAYASFANDGVFCPATPVASYEYSDGTSPAIPETYNPAEDSCRSVMSPAAASGVLRAMRANTYPGEVDGAFGTVARIADYDAVGKSGTNEHLNQAWAQVSKNYSIFTNIYDMDNANAGFQGYWRGQPVYYATAAVTSSDLLRNVVNATNPPRLGLNYDSSERNFVEVPVDNREFFTIPSLSGMKPEQALATARSLGLKAEVSKETRATPEHYAKGVVVEQSLQAGTQLPKGSKKELILFLGD